MNVIKCFTISMSLRTTVSVFLHVSLYECKQSHVSDVLDVRMASISKFSGNLITKYQSIKTMVYI